MTVARAVATGVTRTVVAVQDAAAEDVDLVLAFLNTRDVEAGTDVLDEPQAWRAWVAERGLGRPGAAHAVRHSRDALRDAVTDGSGALPATTVRVRLEAGAPALAADDAVGRVLAAAVRLAVAGGWDRVKICPASDCHWAFYDRSRNRSRNWCSMQACGNREKARQFRRRLRTGG
jgi:predicted RNA-binding Zn ribbon-like protein